MNIEEKEVRDALHMLLSCSLKDTEFETQREQFKIVMNYIEKKEKIINNMSFKIAKLDNSDEYCCGRKRMCPYDKPTIKKCKECVKNYYEKRNKR